MNPFILALKSYNLDVQIHKHSAYQIVFTHDNAFDSVINSIDNQKIFGFIIKPQVAHLCKTQNSIVTIVNIEPYSSSGIYLQSLFPPNSSAIVFDSSNDLLTHFQIQEKEKTTILSTLTRRLLLKNETQKLDERVSSIVDYINNNYHKQGLTPRLFADFIYLSPSRLSALFKQQTGSSLSKYLLWTRLRHAIDLLLSKKDRTLTQIAYDTGFYDLPQLNKYMYEMFGISPKGLRQNSDLIQVSDL